MTELTLLALGPPVRVRFWDPEAITPETETYLLALARRPEISMDWRCWPCAENDCRPGIQHWHPWDTGAMAEWLRQPPPDASRRSARLPPVREIEVAEARAQGGVVRVDGRRRSESGARFLRFDTCGHQTIRPDGLTECSPIFDWSTDDVWAAIEARGWPWNRHYAVLRAAGIKPSRIRCGALHGEECWRSYGMLRRAWPDTWAAMLRRFPGIAQVEADRRMTHDSLAGLSAREKAALVEAKLRALPPGKRRDARASVRKAISAGIRLGHAIPWRAILTVAETGDTWAHRLGMTAVLDAARSNNRPIRGPRSASQRARSLAALRQRSKP